MNKLVLDIFVVLFMAIEVDSYCQNLLDNGSFEKLISSDTCLGDIEIFLNVVNPSTASPDAYYLGCQSKSFGIPRNKGGYQLPLEGNSYVGIVNFDLIDWTYLEQIVFRLNINLVQNQTYELSFYTSLADNSMYYSDSIFIGFCDTLPKLTWHNDRQYLNPDIPYYHKVVLNNAEDTIHWSKQTLRFTARGEEKFICVGVWFQNNYKNVWRRIKRKNKIAEVGIPYAYYYLDNFELKAISKE